MEMWNKRLGLGIRFFRQNDFFSIRGILNLQKLEKGHWIWSCWTGSRCAKDFVSIKRTFFWGHRDRT